MNTKNISHLFKKNIINIIGQKTVDRVYIIKGKKSVLRSFHVLKKEKTRQSLMRQEKQKLLTICHVPNSKLNLMKI